ncbi:MAG TPA: Gfo/Idh/MocA family oxidoreductase, partial [Candidatus Dormibacteraeota bacterium]|nr:Gfo/Idh/MocA family oxidoreductase [Candidatus Dormibacteraeota bacterium]
MSKPDSSNNFPMTRRRFIYSTTLAGVTLVTGPTFAASPRKLSANDKLNIGAVGCGGKGGGDIRCCSTENIIALCDVNENATAKAREEFPKAKVYKDYREMLEKEKSLDAIDVATPDHMHAPIAAMAIKMGKHVYCQKPLTHDVYEARVLRDLAKKHKVATQMGNQGSASDGLRRAVEVVQSGIIGSVHNAYVWTNRPIWKQGLDRPAGSDPVPAGLDWDLWLGTAPSRPYKSSWPDSGGGNRRERGVYTPFSWRGWQDFGTGALGDMACHTANMPFRALKLGYPTEVEARSLGINQESYPLKSKIRFEFPEREGLVPATFWWYDGGNPLPDNPHRHDGNNKPPKDVVAEVEEMTGQVPGSGCILVGDKGKIFSGNDYGARFHLKLKGDKEMVDSEKHDAVKAIPQSIPRNAFGGEGNADKRHHLEWIAACKGGP